VRRIGGTGRKASERYAVERLIARKNMAKFKLLSWKEFHFETLWLILAQQ
jgi:hypothetical protein